ncbi:MAG: RsmB/NOP family class I SAM-dependent RNA methyltransferase [Proteobacteria bacterium]|nr:RsmB/NOP family class I SAM-dependent RNA methyltransferase [Pseudomonadota bacterium]
MSDVSSDTGRRSRAAALRLLGQILDRRQMLDQALADDLESGRRLAGLAPRDRAFARLLTVTVLRRLGQIDDAISRCLDKPLNRAAKPALNALRLAAAQALFLGTPAHAVVDGAVRQMRPRLRHLSGLVNAVSRRLTRDAAPILADQDEVLLNCPDWLWQSWSAAYGVDVARQMVASILVEPSLDLTFKSDPGTWAQALQGEVMVTGSLRRPAGGAIQQLPGFEQGEWWVQDVAAALPVQLLGQVADCEVLDLCAAPGGKTAQLAVAGARVTAIDNAPKRLALLRSNMDRLNLQADEMVADVLSWRPPKPFDFVLLDAPCSATGTIRRHPDIWHLRTPEDIDQAAALQDQLLPAAMEMLAPGGTLIYSTCSLQPEEGEQRIAAFLASGAPAVRRPIVAAELFGLDELITPLGDMRTLPHYLGGMDGFYACRLVRDRT